MKKFLLLAAAALLAGSATAADWYVPGVNGDWNFNANTKMTETPAGSGIYQSKEFATLTGNFQISQANYANQKSTANKAMEYDTEYTLSAGGYQMDMGMKEPGEGAVIIYDSNKNTIKVTRKAAAVIVYDYYIKGSIFGDGWANHKMTKEGEGVYSYTADAVAGEFGCFDAKEGTTTQVNWIGAASSANIVIGTPLAVNIGGGSNIKLSTAGSYKFTLNVNDKTITVTSTAPVYPENLYIIGTVNNADWAPNNGVKMDNEGDGIYTVETELGDSMSSGFGYFSFTTALADNWENMGTRYGASANDFAVALEEEIAIEPGSNSYKLASGKYSFTVNLEDKTLYVEKVEVEPVAPTTISGTSDAQGSLVYNAETDTLEADLTTNEDTVTVTLAIPEGFDNWFVINLPSGGAEPLATRAAEDWITAEQAASNGYPGEFTNTVTVKATADGAKYSYGICPAKDNKILMSAMYFLDITATQETVSGVEGITVEGAEAVYFNVNGTRVANPENGLYIKVVNGKASKVIVK
ncbi:MAG: SusF/SusE family outer membrane protein [Muribaculum sp.]|nr:SusF/SusE family outer membrane protein [Muribaculum sp.]